MVVCHLVDFLFVLIVASAVEMIWEVNIIHTDTMHLWPEVATAIAKKKKLGLSS